MGADYIGSTPFTTTRHSVTEQLEYQAERPGQTAQLSVQIPGVSDEAVACPEPQIEESGHLQSRMHLGFGNKQHVVTPTAFCDGPASPTFSLIARWVTSLGFRLQTCLLDSNSQTRLKTTGTAVGGGRKRCP